MWMKKILNDGNQIHSFISSSGSDFLTSYGSGSTGQKVTVPTVPVPVPQRWINQLWEVIKLEQLFHPESLGFLGAAQPLGGRRRSGFSRSPIRPPVSLIKFSTKFVQSIFH